MPLGQPNTYAGPWFRVGGKSEPRERFHARYPDVGEKLSYSELEQSWFTGGDKPGDVRKFQLSKSQREGFNATLPLIVGHEVEGTGIVKDGDWARGQLKDAGAYLEEVVGLGAYLFRPSSDASDPEPDGVEGAPGVSPDAEGQATAGSADLSRLS